MTKPKLKPKSFKEIAKRDLATDLMFHVPSALIIMFYSKTWLYSFAIKLIAKSESLYLFLRDWKDWINFPLRACLKLEKSK